MKKKLSPGQWIGAVILLLLFILFTFFFYNYFHEDTRFEKFADKFFLSELRTNPISLHYTLADASRYGIDESSLSLPVYQAGQALEEPAQIQETLAALQEFNPERLSGVNQYTYLLLSSYLNAKEDCASYPYYEEPLSPSSGVQANLPVLLAEYRISSVKDIENYIAILFEIPAYLEGIMRYEIEKAEYGLFMYDACADKVIEECTTLMNPESFGHGEHFLEATFTQRLDSLIKQGLINESEAAAWQAENTRLLQTTVAPAYVRLADELFLLKGSGHNTQGLAYFPDGQEYYRAWLRFSTGSYREISEIRQMLSEDFQKNYIAMITLLQEYPSLASSIGAADASFPALTPDDILSKLQIMIAEDYPPIPAATQDTAKCTVKYVDESLAPYSAPAFYLTPPIDDLKQNTIYINRQDTAEGLSLFTTLAHEGYPGHLYQTTYSGYYQRSVGTVPLRSILYYGGYTEGWATYAEFYSYDYAVRLMHESHPEVEPVYLADKLNRQIQLCLYSLLDIAIHYEGASYESVGELLSAIGFTEAEVVRSIYDYILEEPCNYLKYYLGYLEIEALKKEAEEAWTTTAGENFFTVYRFHTFLLNYGPADFRTLSRLLRQSHY